MSGLGYQPRLDGLRAIAVGLVIGVHVFRWPAGGYMGVDLFLVLSGFLITTLLLEEQERHGRISLRSFYARRGLRLLPALWTFLAASVLVFSLRGQQHLLGLALGLSYLTNVGVAVGHYDPAYQHLWSLAMEEQFYLVWPLVLIACLARPRRISKLAVIAAAAAVAIAGARFAATPAHVAVRFGWETVTRFDSILIGCVAALLRRSCVRISRWIVAGAQKTMMVATALVVSVVLLDVARSQTTIYHANTFVFALAAAVIILGAVRSDRCLLLRPLEWRGAVYVGKLSYALYLWHFVLLSMLVHSSGVEVVVASFVIAACSYHFVEKPFLRRKWLLSRTDTRDEAPSRLALASVADGPPIVASMRFAGVASDNAQTIIREGRFRTADGRGNGRRGSRNRA